MPIPFKARVVVPSHVLVQHVDGESVLLNVWSERYFGLDQVGTRIWDLVTTSGSIQSAFEALLEEYDVNTERLRENFEDLLERLLENGLVEAVHE